MIILMSSFVGITVAHGNSERRTSEKQVINNQLSAISENTENSSMAADGKTKSDNSLAADGKTKSDNTLAADGKTKTDNSLDNGRIERLIDLMREKGLISQEDAEILKRTSAAEESAAGSEQALSDVRKLSGVQGLSGMQGLSAGCADRIRWDGDIRLRYEGDFFDQGNLKQYNMTKPVPEGKAAEQRNTTVDRQRFRVRFRLSLKTMVTDQVEAGAKLTTGSESDPGSTNETLGDSFNKDGIVLDNVYLKWNIQDGFQVWGGRMPNPWFCSDLVWDGDLNFEGVALNYGHRITKGLEGFLTLGAFPLEELEWSTHDKWLYGGQAGIISKPVHDLTIKVAAAYYDYQNIEGERDPNRPMEMNFSTPRFMQKGNTLMDIDPTGGYVPALASDYHELDITGSADIGFFDPVHITFLTDYVKNLGFDRAKAARLIDDPNLKSQATGYQMGLTVGHLAVRQPGTWKCSGFYRHLEADAVLDAFTDSDFHLGGTNACGWILGGELGLAQNDGYRRAG
jgi:hypothetical protein